MLLKDCYCLFAGGIVAGATTGIFYSTNSENEEKEKQTQFDVKLAFKSSCVPALLGHTEQHKFGKIYICAAKPEKDTGKSPLLFGRGRNRKIWCFFYWRAIVFNE